MVTKKDTKKLASTKKGATKKRASKKIVAKKTDSAGKKQVVVTPEIKMPIRVTDDGKILPTNSGDSLNLKLVEQESAANVKGPQDGRELIREQRRLEKQRRMEALKRQREAANAAAELGNVASIDAARKRQGPSCPLIHAPNPPGLDASRDEKANHISVEISELLKYKLLAKESAHRAVVEPIKQGLKEAAQRKLSMDIMKALSTNEKCVQTGKELEDCVNEILVAVQPHLPQGYAVVHIAAEDSVAVCKYAPEQVGKKFRLELR